MQVTKKCSRCGKERTYLLTIDEFEHFKDIKLCIECEEYVSKTARTILKETIDAYESELMGLRTQDAKRVEQIKSIVENLRKAVDRLGGDNNE